MLLMYILTKYFFLQGVLLLEMLEQLIYRFIRTDDVQFTTAGLVNL